MFKTIKIIIWLIIAIIFFILFFKGKKVNKILEKEKNKSHRSITDDGSLVFMQSIEESLKILSNSILYVSNIGGLGFIISIVAAVLSALI